MIRSCYKNAEMSPLWKVKLRRLATRKKAAEMLADIISGDADVYIAYRGLYALWCSNNAAVQELRPMFRMDEPDGLLSVTAEFCAKVQQLAKEILPQLSE